ncbi:hypothetical protein ACVU7I_01345 [Patulibacter sp. S7RM1-6]
MLKKSRTLAVAVGTAALVATGASAASATTLSNAGGALANGSVVSGPLATPATLTVTGAGGGTATCTTGSLGGTVANNGAAAVGLTSPTFTLGTCTDTIAPFNITGASLQSVASSTISSTGSGTGNLNITTANIRVNITSGGLPGTCNMVANTVTGAAANSDNSITFSGVNVSSASGVCQQVLPASFSAKFRPMTSGGSNVTVNP